MNVYDKPLIYTLSHIVFGAVAVYYPAVLYIFVIYQLAQLILNVRVFALATGQPQSDLLWGPLFGLHGEIRVGNNPLHTARKLAEFGLGYAAAYLFKHYKSE